MNNYDFRRTPGLENAKELEKSDGITKTELLNNIAKSRNTIKIRHSKQSNDKNKAVNWFLHVKCRLNIISHWDKSHFLNIIK